MKQKLIALIVIFSLFINVLPCFAEDTKNTTPEPYKEGEFPSWLSDLRRAEIITLGAMPFITFNVQLGYSFGVFAANNFDPDYFKNPFAATASSNSSSTSSSTSTDTDTNSYTEDEQIGILLTSLGICVGIGITDFVVNQIKKSRKQKRAKMTQNRNINIEPISENPNATAIPQPPRKIQNSPTDEKLDSEIDIVDETDSTDNFILTNDSVE